MRVLITGATGFLGKYIIEEFAKHNCKIIAFGRNADIGKSLENCTFVQGDFTNYREINNATKGVDVVIHAGALCTVWGNWQDFYNTNVLGTKNVLNACLENSIKKFVFVSSSSVYSCPHDRLNIKENEVDETNDLNFYIKTKIMAEKLINDYRKKHGISCSIIRPHGIFGIGDVSIMPRLLKVNKKIGIPLFNKGNNLIDIVCAENIAYSLWLAANSEKSGTYNITNGEITTYKELVGRIFSGLGMEAKHFNMNFKVAYFIAGVIEKIYKILKFKSEPILTRYTLTTVGVSETFDLSKAKEELGYESQKTLQEGILAYAKWWKENN